MAKHNTTGKWGEEVAADYLAAKGYAITERNWKLNHLELDIVAMKGNRIVFVEVKTRSGSLEDALSAVDRKKMTRIVNAANTYVRVKDIPHEVQYDIITIVGTPDNYTIDHIPDAFLAPLRSMR